MDDPELLQASKSFQLTQDLCEMSPPKQLWGGLLWKFWPLETILGLLGRNSEQALETVLLFSRVCLQTKATVNDLSELGNRESAQDMSFLPPNPRGLARDGQPSSTQVPRATVCVASDRGSWSPSLMRSQELSQFKVVSCLRF